MTAVGTLQASCNRQPCQVVAEVSRLVLHLRGWRDVWSLRSNARALGHLAPTLERAGLGLAVQIGTGRVWPVLPRPHPIARWFLPKFDSRSPRR